MKLFKKRKYKILKNDSIKYNNHTLYRIQALRDFGNVNKGDIGGYVECKDNLSQYGNCWIGDDAKVFGIRTIVQDNAKVYGNAIVFACSKVCGNAEISDNAKISSFSIVCDNALVFGDARVNSSNIGGSARIFESARIIHDSKIEGNCWIHGNTIVNNTMVADNARIHDNAQVKHASILGSAEIYDNAIIDAYAGNITMIYGNAKIHGKAKVSFGSFICNNVDVSDNADIIESNLFNDAKIYGNAVIISSTIFGNAKAYGHSVLSGVYMYENAEVYGSDTRLTNVRLCGNACIKSNNNFIIIGNMIEWGDNIIFYITKDKSIMVNYGNDNYTFEEFEVDMIEKLSDDKEKSNRLIATINYVRSILQ